MGVSTNGILFYGYHLPEGTEVSEEAQDTYLTDAPVQVGVHGYIDYPFYYVFAKESQVTAYRGTPKRISHLHIVPVTEETHNWDDLIVKFAKEHDIPLPTFKPEEYMEPASEIGWWLASYWG